MLRSEAQHHAVSYYQAETMKTDRSPDQKSNPKPSRRRRGTTAPQRVEAMLIMSYVKTYVFDENRDNNSHIGWLLNNYTRLVTIIGLNHTKK